MIRLSNKKKGKFIKLSLESKRPLCRGKSCTDCCRFLEFIEYHKRKDSLDGFNNTCKDCTSARMVNYYNSNKDKVKKRVALYVDNNRELVNSKKREWGKRWRAENPEKVKEKGRKYNQEHKGKKNHYTAKRRAEKKKATPKWLSKFDLDYIKNLYIQSTELNKIEETIYNVDHIIPLQHELVCGLHVPWNLQIIPSSENFIKSNNFDGTNDNENWKEKIN